MNLPVARNPGLREKEIEAGSTDKAALESDKKWR
jgi:hypothetical protein